MHSSTESFPIYTLKSQRLHFPLTEELGFMYFANMSSEGSLINVCSGGFRQYLKDF